MRNRATPRQLEVLRLLAEGHDLYSGGDYWWFQERRIGQVFPKLHAGSMRAMYTPRRWIRFRNRGQNRPFWRTDWALTDAGREALLRAQRGGREGGKR